MDQILVRCLSFMIIGTALFHIGSSSDVYFEIRPDKVEELTSATNVTLSCLYTVSHMSGTELLAMELRRGQDEPITIVRQCSDISLGHAANARYRVEGHLERNATTNHIRMTIMNPTKNEEGVYSCFAMLIDEKGSMRQETATANLTVDSPDLRAVFHYLTNKISTLEDQVMRSEDTIRRQNDTIVDLRERLEEQESELTRQYYNLEQQNNTLQDHNSKLDVQTTRLNEQSSMMNDQAMELNKQKQFQKLLNFSITANVNRIEAHAKELWTQRDSIADHATKIMSSYDKIKDLEDVSRNQSDAIAAFTEKESYTVAFFALYDSRDTFAVGSTVVFRKVLMKQGQGYDENTGIFTAPKPGIYVFHLTVTSAATKLYYNVDLEVNDKRQVRLFAYDADLYADQSTVSCIVNLQEGDTVKAVIVNKSDNTNTFLNLSYYSTFAGYLVKASW